MSFDLGSYVEWKHTKGYIRYISDDYISICVNVKSDDCFMDCCVVCYKMYWDEVKVIKEVPPIFPIMNPARSLR
jgi:hypothetical protein